MLIMISTVPHTAIVSSKIPLENDLKQIFCEENCLTFLVFQYCPLELQTETAHMRADGPCTNSYVVPTQFSSDSFVSRQHSARIKNMKVMPILVTGLSY